MAGLTPTKLTLKRLRADGWPLVGITEHWMPNPSPGHRSDLFGFVDILALGPDLTLAIQATSWGNVSHRLRKLRTERAGEVAAVLAAGWEVEVWGWRKVNSRWRLARRVSFGLVMSGLHHVDLLRPDETTTLDDW